MTPEPDRQVPQTLADLMVDVLHANEVQAANVQANAKAVNDLIGALSQVAVALEARPTKREAMTLVAKGTTLLLVLAVGLLGLIWTDLRAGQRYIRAQVESTAGRSSAAICGILNDGRKYHGQPPVPGCPTATTRPVPPPR